MHPVVEQGIPVCPFILFFSCVPFITRFAKGVTPMASRSPTQRKGRSWLLIFLIVPFIVLLYPPVYNSIDPTLIGIPFFYWFPLLWIIITAVITGALYF